MSSVDRLTGEDGRVRGWRARWRTPAGASRTRTFDRKVDADRFLAALSSDRLRGSYVEPNDRTTVGTFGALVIRQQAHLKPSSRARVEGVWERYVEPRWGATPLAAVGHSAVAEWVSGLSVDGLAPTSVRKAVGALSTVLQAAVLDQRLARNVCRDVRLPRVVNGAPRFLTIAQVEQLASECGESSALVRFLAVTGVRFGEAAGLRVEQLDLMRRRAHLVEQVTEVDGRQVWGTLKGHRARTVPVPGMIVDELAALVAGQPRDAMVFRSPAGGVLGANNWRRRTFDPAVRAVGLGHFTPHDMRHTAASLAIASGASVKGVQTMLGHASAAMTLDVYAGLFPDELGAVADRLDAAWAAAAVSPVSPVCHVAEVVPIGRASATR